MDFFVQLFTNPVGFYNQHELLIAQMGINAILAIAIFVTFYSGQLTLANAGFMAIGAYTTVIMNLYLPTPLPLDMLAGALLAGGAPARAWVPISGLHGVIITPCPRPCNDAPARAVNRHVPIDKRHAAPDNPDRHHPPADR